MNKLLIVKLVFVSLLVFTNSKSLADDYQGVQADLNNGLLPVEAAKRAHENELFSADVVQQMVDSDVDIVKAVQTVAREWSSCDDTYASVRKGVQLSSDRADEIVASVATINGCKCNAQSFWARSRLEQRLRPRIQRALAEISTSCSCASAGIEAAIEIVPDKVEDMVDAVIVAKNRAERTIDSIGQVGVLPEQKFWGDQLVKTKDTNLIRNTEVCSGDYNELDEFDPNNSWSNQDKQTDSATFAYNRDLGTHKLICEEEETKEEEEETENDSEKLIISQYIEGQGSDQALELYNGSDKEIDLYAGNYQLEVYFHGYDFPGEVIQLKGLMAPQSTFVVADAQASSDISAKANQKVNGLIFKGADAVVLKAGFNNSPCECAVASIASAVNGIEKSEEKNAEMSQEKEDFIKRIEHHYDNTNVQATVVDSLGRILANKDGEQKDVPVVEDATIRRIETVCKGDRIEMDEFDLNKEWQTYAIDNFIDSGSFSTKDCAASRKDLLLSEYIEGTENNAMIELYNGTDRPIDFSSEKYFLELYNDDDDDPESVIYLDGKVDRGGVFVVAHSDAEEALRDIANQKTSELDLENTRAVVLKKVVLPAYQSCYADIANWIQGNDLKNIAYILPPQRDPGTGPDPSDDPRDGPDGGELASPN